MSRRRAVRTRAAIKTVVLMLLAAVIAIGVKNVTANDRTEEEREDTGYREIRIVQMPKEAETPTPYPDFDLYHLSIVGKEAKTNETDRRTDSLYGDTAGLDRGHVEDAQRTVDCLEEGDPEGADGHESGMDNSAFGGDTDNGSNEFNGDSEHSTYSDDGWSYYGECRITFYDDCEECCGVAGNTTASGVYPTSNHTVATGEDLPFGTKLLIDGQVYVVEDRGVDPHCVDIFVDEHETAVALGMYYTDVYMRNAE